VPLVGEQLEQAQYGCIFCRTRREKSVVQALEEQYPGLRATAVSQIKHRSEQGRKYTEESILLPGYVFFRSEIEPINAFHVQDAIRLLKSSDGAWQLRNSDLRFVEFVFEHGGIIGFSKVRNVGDHVKIIDGPLKAMEGQIVKIDRRNRNGLVEFRFDDRVWRIWLAFEVVE